VIGLGAQSDYDDAQDFVARHGITFRMFWDSGFDSWDGYGVRGTPTSILVSRSGMTMKRWLGVMSDEERAEAVGLARDQG
jgi:hypothetical protein